MKQLLREWEALPSSNGKLITEARETNGGRLFLTGPMQRCEAPNQNKRIYPKNILQREYTNLEKIVKEGRACGELDHPETSTVSLERVSHIIREMFWDGNVWMGRIEIIPTPCGKIAETLIECGVTLGISSRGVGSTSTNESGLDIVQDDFSLVCFDLVQEPSTHNAFMRLSESFKDAKFSRREKILIAINELKKFSK